VGADEGLADGALVGGKFALGGAGFHRVVFAAGAGGDVQALQGGDAGFGFGGQGFVGGDAVGEEGLALALRDGLDGEEEGDVW
jgi:hypothetical protein